MPADPSIAGTGVFLQSIVLQPAGCLRPSDGYAVTVQATTLGG